MPVPNDNQLRLQDMEMYAFLHYSLNTYTDQEWGYGNEDPSLFNPSALDARQWARTCKGAGMKGIILTVKHHCGFCLWPSAYTDFSVKNAPWRNGKGDVLRELADACREEGLRLGVYLSPWDRNHPRYGYPEYIDYFRNQLRELLTNYGDIFEVWFDGANGGNGWYGGADETRRIDRAYYGWPETHRLIRELQPDICIWSDAGSRGDLRWVGTEAGYVGLPNWALLPATGDLNHDLLHHGAQGGDVWVLGEVNTSIRPGWFYHTYEDGRVKTLSRLMDTYYKSVGRGSTLLLNFPIQPNGLIHPTDSARGAAFYKMVQTVFSHNLLADGAEAEATNVRGNSRRYNPSRLLDGKDNTYWAVDDSVRRAAVTIRFDSALTFNRVQLAEPVQLGQRVSRFALHALVNGQWQSLHDALQPDENGLTTIGRRRIVCLPHPVTATALRLSILDARACPLISEVALYLAPRLTPEIPDSGERYASRYRIAVTPAPSVEGGESPLKERAIIVDLGQPRTVKGLRYLPPQRHDGMGTITQWTLNVMQPDGQWQPVSNGEFSNVVNNPIWQTINVAPVTTQFIRLEANALHTGNRPAFDDIQVLTQE